MLIDVYIGARDLQEITVMVVTSGKDAPRSQRTLCSIVDAGDFTLSSTLHQT